MSQIDTLQVSETRVNPALLMGAASPLWGYFGAVAAGGVAYWWMTRWTRPMNVESIFGVARAPADMTLEVVEVIEARAPLDPDAAVTESEAMPMMEAAAVTAPPILEPSCDPEAEPVPDVEPATINFTEAAPLATASLMVPPEPEPEPGLETKPIPSTSIEGAPVTEVKRPSTPRVRKQTAATPDAEA